MTQLYRYCSHQLPGVDAKGTGTNKIRNQRLIPEIPVFYAPLNWSWMVAVTAAMVLASSLDRIFAVLSAWPEIS